MTTLKEMNMGVKVAIAIFAVLIIPGFGGVVGWFVNSNSQHIQTIKKDTNDKINKIAVASICSDKEIKKDVAKEFEIAKAERKEMRKLSIDNARQIAVQNATYRSDARHISEALAVIQSDLKEMKKK